MNVTLDNNCFNIKEHATLDKIFVLAEKEEITISFADATIYNILRGNLSIDDLKNSEREMAKKRLDKANKYRRLPSWQTFTNHYNRFPLVFADIDFNEKIADILFPDRENGGKYEEEDVRQMIAHIRSGNDIFLTNNSKDFIDNNKREKLFEMGGKVQTPEEFIKEWEQH